MKLNIGNKTLWQIGSGDGTRDYSNICLKYGVAILGPGNPGSAKNETIQTKQYYKDNPNVTNWGKKLLEVKKGDYILLRKGLSTILAVGKVIEEYNYSMLFSDVLGWDLQHFVQVEWFVPKYPIKLIGKPLMRATLSRVGINNKIVRDSIDKEGFNLYSDKKIELEKLTLPKQIKIDDLNNSLIDSGIRIQDAYNITSTIEKVIRLAKWYMDNDPDALEYEIRTFLVAPLMISLGWSEQKMKLEYNKIDLAVFKKTFNGDYKTNPYIIFETKSFYDGLTYAGVQVKNYAKKYPKCELLVTTNGFRYKLFKKNSGVYNEFGYFNLFDLREKHYLDNQILGSVESILSLSNF